MPQSIERENSPNLTVQHLLMPDNGGECDPLPGDFPDVPLPPFPVVDCGGLDASSFLPPVSPPAFASLPCQMRAGEETPPVVPSGMPNCLRLSGVRVPEGGGAWAMSCKGLGWSAFLGW